MYSKIEIGCSQATNDKTAKYAIKRLEGRSALADKKPLNPPAGEVVEDGLGDDDGREHRRQDADGERYGEAGRHGSLKKPARGPALPKNAFLSGRALSPYP